MRGRKPIPTIVKSIRGTDRPCRRPTNEPAPEGEASCPEFLTAEAKREWRRLEDELHRIGLLTIVDRAAMAGYCQAWADFRWTIDFLRHRQKIVQAPSGYKQIHPVMTVRRQSAKQMLAFAAELGLTPSARARLSVPTPGEGEDKFESYLRRGRDLRSP